MSGLQKNKSGKFAAVRRVPNIHIALRDDLKPDVGQLLRGSLAFNEQSKLIAVTTGDQREHVLGSDELATLLRIPEGRWTNFVDREDPSPFDESILCRLIDRGLLISDPDRDQSTDSRVEQTKPQDLGWNVYAALYHSLSRWQEPVRGRPEKSEDPACEAFDSGNLFEDIVNRHGPPPGEFYSIGDDPKTTALPIFEQNGALFTNLKNRHTVREFDASRQVSLADFSTLLLFTFGCHGTKQLADHVVALKKCSPSGGALHPIEAYPLVLNVEGIDPGLYHYSVEHHSLELISETTEDGARQLALDVTAGQEWFQSASSLFILTGRFDRLFWKYRNNSKAYKVLFLDAGHLSQTFYLLCQEMGLGAFFTGAINDSVIEQRLGLTRDREGAIGVTGCGIPDDSKDDLRFDCEPFVIRRPKS